MLSSSDRCAGFQTLVRNAGNNPVVWASSSLRDLTTFTPRPTMRPRAPDADKTLRGIRASTDFTGRALPLPTKIRKVSPPRLVVFAGTERQTVAPRMATEYTAETDSALAEWTVVADAESGDVLQRWRRTAQLPEALPHIHSAGHGQRVDFDAEAVDKHDRFPAEAGAFGRCQRGEIRIDNDQLTRPDRLPAPISFTRGTVGADQRCVPSPSPIGELSHREVLNILWRRDLVQADG